MARISLEERLATCDNALLRKLLAIMIEKKTQLCVAANFKTLSECVDFVDKAGKHICILKVQYERFSGSSPEEIFKALYAKKKEHNFLLFEDRKYFDGEETVRSIYGTLVAKYVDLVTINPIIGDPIFKAIRDVVNEASLPADEPRGCLAVCELSFQGVLPMDSQSYLELAVKNKDICIGIIAQKLKVPENLSAIKVTPGVHIERTTSGDNQRWNHPNQVMAEGADVIIVGRGIVSCPPDQLEQVARQYKEVAWKSYCEQINRLDII